MGKSKLLNVILRYIILLIIGLNLSFIYTIFTPLTVYPVYFLLNLFFNTTLQGTNIIINCYTIQLVEACIAGSAYYLLLILNLTTPIKLKTRILSLVYSILVFLIINIIRIFIFSILFIESFSLFNITHLITWYGLSGIIVFLIWYSEIKLFKIKNIPIYTDLKLLKKRK